MSDEYDLSSFAADRNTRLIRWGFGLGFLVPIGGLVWYATTLPLSYFASLGGAVVTALVLSFASVMALGIVAFGPGARLCVFDQSGFTLYLGRRRTRRYDWASPRLKLEIEVLSQGSRNQYYLSTGLPFTSNLGPLAFARLLEEASQRGLTIRTVSSTVPSVTGKSDTSVVEYRIARDS